MRPGQLTPENIVSLVVSLVVSLGFNEAGAINPGKRWLKVATFWDDSKLQ